MAAVKELTAFREKWGEQYEVYVPHGERLEYQEYIALLKDSKIVLSPWGWGEWSHKVRLSGGGAGVRAALAMLRHQRCGSKRRAHCHLRWWPSPPAGL